MAGIEVSLTYRDKDKMANEGRVTNFERVKREVSTCDTL